MCACIKCDDEAVAYLHIKAREVCEIIIILLTAIEFSLGGSSPYTSTEKTNKIKYHKRNYKKKQNKQYKTQ